MSAAITTTATNLPAQALEVLSALQVAEAASTLVEKPNNVDITTDVDNAQVTISVTLPVAFSASGTGIKFTATDYLV
jgi:hypothetical protein